MNHLSAFVLFAALTTVAVGCGPRAAPSAKAPADKDRLQGVWAVESVECGVELTAEARKRVLDSRLHVHETRFVLGEGDNWEFFTFATDNGIEPKRLLLHDASADGKQAASRGIPKAARARGWLYKFEDEKLVLAFLRGSDLNSIPPPADFKAEPGQDVMVLRLVKTNEEPKTTRDVNPGAKK